MKCWQRWTVLYEARSRSLWLFEWDNNVKFLEMFSFLLCTLRPTLFLLFAPLQVTFAQVLKTLFVWAVICDWSWISFHQATSANFETENSHCVLNPANMANEEAIGSPIQLNFAIATKHSLLVKNAAVFFLQIVVEMLQ